MARRPHKLPRIWRGPQSDAFVLRHAFIQSDDASEDCSPAMSVPVASVRVRRLGAGVKKLASSVHAHGSWEEGAIFDFLRAELPSFSPFHAALTGEHHGAADVAAEVRCARTRCRPSSTPVVFVRSRVSRRSSGSWMRSGPMPRPPRVDKHVTCARTSSVDSLMPWRSL